MKKFLYNLSFSLLAISSSSLAHANGFSLKVGDLLFQDSNCGVFCDSIDNVTAGYQNTYVSHVALVVNTKESDPLLIEATTTGVKQTHLSEFLNSSVDEHNYPRVMVGRFNQQYNKLIPQAISYAQKQLGKPYNNSFIAANGNSFYCSELIADSFKYANQGKNVFATYPMNFTDKNGHISPLWVTYYQNLGLAVPEGKLGTNPGHMSRESNVIAVIYFYGDLRKH